MALSRAPARSPSVTPSLAPSVEQGASDSSDLLMYVLFGDLAPANLAMLQGTVGNQALAALADLSGPGLDGFEATLDAGAVDLASRFADVPGLNVAAEVASIQAQNSVECGVGAARTGLEMVSGLAGMVVHPLDATRGMATMLSHTGVPVLAAGARASVNALDVLSGDKRLVDAATDMNKDVVSQGLDDAAYWKTVGGALLDPYVDCVEKGRPYEAIGRGAAELLMMFAGEAGALSKASKAGKAAEVTKLAETAHVTRLAEVAEAGNAAGDAAGLAADVGKAERAAESARALDATADTGRAEALARDGWTTSTEEALGGARQLEAGTAENKVATQIEGRTLAGEEANKVVRQPRSRRAQAEAAIRQAKERMGGDPRFWRFDPEQVINEMVFTKEEVYMQRVMEGLTHSTPGLTWEQAASMTDHLPSLYGQRTEHYLRPTGLKEPPKAVVHLSDAVAPGDLAEVTQHEVIHSAAHPSFQNGPAMPLNEGITQWLTNGFMRQETAAYGETVQVVKDIARKVGVENVIDCFTKGGRRELMHLLEVAEPGAPALAEKALKEAQMSDAGIPATTVH